MPIDPLAAAVDAVASHFVGRGTPPLRARRGWPEHGVDLDLEAGPLLSVFALEQPAATRCSPRAVVVTGEGAQALTTYRVGYLRVAMQLDLWAKYRAQRDDSALAVETAVALNLPHHAGLRLSSTGYYSRPLTLTLGAGRAIDDASKVETGEWRQVWTAVVETDLVAQVTHPRLLNNAFQVVTQHLGLEVTEPTRTLT